jgi:hypothetical protein
MSVIILRGISGAGKSTYAKKLEEKRPGLCIVSADNFFIDDDGVYTFVPKLLPDAHRMCLREFADLVRIPTADMLVDNTNTSVVEIAPYMALAQAYGHEARIITLKADVILAALRNAHGTPLETVGRQNERLLKEQELFPPWWRHEVIEGEPPAEERIHLLEHGLPRCRFSFRPPVEWPPGHKWLGVPLGITCKFCQTANPSDSPR